MKKYTKEELDVDVRFILANERTLLAWIRTSLTVVAGGVALSAIHSHHRYIGITITLLGAAMAIIGYHRYRAADKAIRSSSLPHLGLGPTIEVIMVVVVAIALAVAELTVIN
jgi:putative membrane protein